MSFVDRSTFRSILYVVGCLIWLGAVAALVMLNVAWHEVVAEPAGENTLAGLIWILLGPAIPVALAVSGLLLYSGWETFGEVSSRGARLAAGSVPLLGVAYLLGLFTSPSLFGVIVMDIGAGGHILAVLGLLTLTFVAGRVPWESDEAAGDAESEPLVTNRYLRAGMFVVGTLFWLLLGFLTMLHLFGVIAGAVSEARTEMADAGFFFAWAAPLWAGISYGLLVFCGEAVDAFSERVGNVARGSGVAAIIAGMVATVSLGSLPLAAAILEAVIMAVHLGSVVVVFGAVVFQGRGPWTLSGEEQARTGDAGSVGE